MADAASRGAPDGASFMSDLIISISGVRGIVGETLTPETALAMAAAFAEVAPAGPILVASDGRTSGDALRAACIAGLTGAGRATVDLGVATTPTTGVVVPLRRAAGAIIVTASHNPAEWNGLKFLGPDGLFIRQDTIDRLVARWRAKEPAWQPWEHVGRADHWDGAAAAHIERILALDIIDVPRCREARVPVVLDAICGSGATIAPELLDALGCVVHAVNTEVTGRFPRMPEPVPEHIAPVGDVVRRTGAAVGLVLDPDGDRLALLDEHGTAIGEEYTLALAVYSIRRRRQGGPVVVNASTSRMVDDMAAMLGFSVHRTPVGEINVVDGMIRLGADLGGEGNGGVIYRDLHLGRDGLLGIAVIIDLLARERCPLSELVGRLPRYVISKQKVAVAPEARAAYLGRFVELAAARGAILDTCDGAKLIWPDRWLHVRPSNTEPVVRVIAEAPTEGQALALCREAQELVPEV